MTKTDRPLRRADKLRQALEDDIATGALPIGTRLDEVKLAQRFGVSRTPIREALIELATAGLVEQKPRRGAFVREIGIPRLIEMFEVMADLEATCGRLAARRISLAETQILKASHIACEDALTSGDPDRYYQANQHFHETIYQASHNGFLAEQAIGLHSRLAPYRRLQLRARNRVAVSLHEHAEIVAAIVSGQAEAAADCLRQHVLIQGERFNDFVATLAATSTQQERERSSLKSASAAE
ncbi:GntR family transcriptional regulator [Roseibium sp. CAU 1637]|uniref:GntR family transcriptional regulator n=1 Tax=Roseibium limicola TaxID=2816037 RepID=A0A939EMU8_9HYPH|nr:GntR family transcriptional regulator [Roseibium limicola]MBO0345342.1 GntR family transcriptional regulator [Roseibium limicola]